MKHVNAKQLTWEILACSDIQINGNRPWDIQVNNSNFYNRVLTGYALTLGESYMDGWWNCAALDQFFDRILSARIDKKIKKETILKDTKCGLPSATSHTATATA